jgi:trk system potassium uptake protein TrkA
MKVAIVGGGKVGRFVARDLVTQGHTIQMLENDDALIGRHRDSVPAEWVRGDACEVATLEAAKLEEADVLIAATGDDKVNLVVSLLAKQEFAVPRVIARVNHPKNEWLFTDSWGVDRAVSGAHLLVGLVEEAVSVGALVQLLSLEGGQAQLVEVTLASGATAVGQLLGELDFPREASVVAVVRSGHVMVPHGDIVLEGGDEVLVLIVGEVRDELTRLLTT